MPFLRSNAVALAVPVFVAEIKDQLMHDCDLSKKNAQQ